jgi:hypothetical protein
MTSYAVTIVDETSGGEQTQRSTLRLVSQRITARALIEQRVRQEVEAFNARPVEVYRGLVQPTDAELALNGYRVQPGRAIDADTQCAQALKSFETNGFLMFANDKQIEALDEEILIGEETEVSFVKLIPLVGG